MKFNKAYIFKFLPVVILSELKGNSDTKREKLDGRKGKEKCEANPIRSKGCQGSCLDCVMLKDSDNWLKLEKISCGACEWEDAR